MFAFLVIIVSGSFSDFDLDNDPFQYMDIPKKANASVMDIVYTSATVYGSAKSKQALELLEKFRSHQNKPVLVVEMPPPPPTVAFPTDTDNSNKNNVTKIDVNTFVSKNTSVFDLKDNVTADNSSVRNWLTPSDKILVDTTVTVFGVEFSGKYFNILTS